MVLTRDNLARQWIRRILQTRRRSLMFSVMRRSMQTLISLFTLLLLCAAANAQSVTGSISGTVTDASGAVVPGTALTLIQDKTNEARTLTSDNDGRFTFAAVQPGNYSLRIE